MMDKVCKYFVCEDEEKKIVKRIAKGEHRLCPLFCRDAKGHIRVWHVYTEGNVVRKTHGILLTGSGKEGQTRTTERKVNGKNLGKKNELTSEEQAAVVAERDWMSQIDKGYRPFFHSSLYEEVIETKRKYGGNSASLSNIDTGISKNKRTIECENKAELGISPMLCGVFKENGAIRKHIDPMKGFYIQPKLDGIRCVARRERDGSISLTSRKGKHFGHLSHLRECLKEFYSDLDKGLGDIVLDGELYCHCPKIGENITHFGRYNFIGKACRVVGALNKPLPQENQIEYHIFDLVSDGDQRERFNILLSLNLSKYTHLKIVKTIFYEKQSDYDILKYEHDKFVAKGYEGIVIRAVDCPYEEKKRSLKIRKYKVFDDAEFEILDGLSCEGTEEGLVKWLCKHKDKTFECRQAGDFETRRLMYENKEEYIGKSLVVRFHGFTDDGVPRFPIGFGVRLD